ncbi:MAG: DNA mismatch repair endonuclease MutL, partial [Planctomycetota bacterium]
IGSVAKVAVTSRTADAIGGHVIEIDCGEQADVRPCSAVVGTTIEVRNLFYKLPVRRKFLRTPGTEFTHIKEHFTRIALAHDSLDLTLRHNGKDVYRLLSGQSVRERIGVLFGRELAEDLLSTSRAERGMQIRGLMARPVDARASGKYQYLFLNGRFIRDKFILHAVKEAYRGLMEPNKYPVVFLFIEMPPEDYDVNVHPTKTEVRFDNSNLVHSEVLAVLRDKLLSTNLDVGGRVPSYGTGGDDDGDLEIPPAVADGGRQERIHRAMEDFFNKPTSSQGTFSFPKSSGSATGGGGHMSIRALEPPITSIPEFSDQSRTDDWIAKEFLQVHNSYILLQNDDGFAVIDQHALHERILYEQMTRRLREGNLTGQRLLMPHSFEVTNAQSEAFEARGDLFEKLGIEVEPFGPDTLAIQTFPTMLEKADPVEFVIETLDKLIDDDKADEERLLHEILDMASCKAAIKAGQPLSQEEIAVLLKDKDIVQRTSRCPHGRPTTIAFSIQELEKQFKRTGF